MSGPASINPYQSPSATDSIAAGRQNFVDISTKDLKVLRNDSHTIRTVAALLIFGLLIILVGLFLAPVGAGGIGLFELMFMALFGAWNLVVVIGLITRANWGRILGFIGGAVMLLGFPIGTLIGVFFLISLFRGKRLFGNDRYPHRELETEWKYRKKLKVE